MRDRLTGDKCKTPCWYRTGKPGKWIVASAPKRRRKKHSPLGNSNPRSGSRPAPPEESGTPNQRHGPHVTKQPDTTPIKWPITDGIPFPEKVAVLHSDTPVFYPSMIAPIVVTDEATQKMVDGVLRGDRLIGVFPSELPSGSGSKDAPAPIQAQGVPLFKVGTLCVVLRLLKMPDGSVRLLVHGVTRIMIEELVEEKPYPVAAIRRVDDIEVEDVEVEALRKMTLEELQKAIALTSLPEDLAVAAYNVEEPGKLADLVASNLNLKPDAIRDILAERNTKKRLQRVFDLLSREVYVMEIGNTISERVREDVDRHQRDFFLREQIKAMRNELGERDPHEAEIDELRERLKDKAMPAHARTVAERELGRLAHLQPAAAEYSVIRTYLEWILDLPWEEATDDKIDLDEAARILDEDHYGLEKVKERILEYLAVIRLKKGNLKGPILCLVGPPGVGKTSLGKSVARATGRKFARFSLGGMRDEAEIRGHRRTYIGAMPGRIVKALKDCGSINPLVMLDEVDKLGSDFRGDPASALLEVLDPEQNDSFTDHYMDMPIDLSRVMFITTANTLDTIPGPLRDRMEIIRLAGYTREEKLQIASKYLVPKEIDNAGLRKSDVRFRAAGLRRLIAYYTAEAGVRGLQKEIASICRKAARKRATELSRHDHDEDTKAAKPKFAPVVVDADAVEELLGPPKTYNEVAERMGRPGVAIGLAWTSIGGEILFVEASAYPGKAALKLTGQLGDVMKESANAALTWLRTNRQLVEVDDSVFADQEFHVHVPAGATPKDGPSAGVAMAVVLASLVTGRLVRDYVAMTGEISLRGTVLPVGGIKEKVLAAHRAGIKEVVLPKKNERDLDEIPKPVRKAMKFHLIDRVEQALDVVLQK
ncbi:MAG: ATP-dependent Lon protease [Candidatus Sumerlaeota bacterium]|nr:ATP-dependent Lon protease [Candidatus Sumerlaeota bacterium]